VQGTGSGVIVEIDWDVPFADSNYSVSLSAETTILAGRLVTLNSFTKTASGIQVFCSAPNLVPYVLHAVAFHD